MVDYYDLEAPGLKVLVRLSATRERGWSVVGNHATRGVLAVGLSVHDSLGDVVVGISVATTEARMPKERQRKIAQLIRQALRAHRFVAY